MTDIREVSSMNNKGSVSLLGFEALSARDVVDVLRISAGLRCRQGALDMARALIGHGVSIALITDGLPCDVVLFKVACGALGVTPIVMSLDEFSLSFGADMTDAARSLASIVDTIILDIPQAAGAKEFAEAASTSVVVLRDREADFLEPFAALLTILEAKGTLAGLTMAYVGHADHQAAGYLRAGACAGLDVVVAVTGGHEVGKLQQIIASSKQGIHLELLEDTREALSGADVVVVGEKAGKINEDLLDLASSGFIVLASLPLQRGSGLKDSVIDSDSSWIDIHSMCRLQVLEALIMVALGHRGFLSE